MTERTPDHGRAPVHTWLADPLPRPVAAAIDRLARAPDVRHIAVMPDVHLAQAVCVGCVVATATAVYPQAVGSDIGCGMASLALDASTDLLASESAAHSLLADLRDAVPIMRHRSLATSPPLPSDLADAPLSDPGLVAASLREGRVEMGTLGRGNHFLEFQADTDGRLWLTVHSGSRAMGQLVTAHHTARAAPAGSGLVVLDAANPAGAAYLSDAAWAERYAAHNRRLMLDAAASALKRRFKVEPYHGSLISCSHNHVRRERHGGLDLLVHRKGASPAADAEPGIIPGSMGSETFHVTGRGNPAALCSSSHGAGRIMTRTEARARVTPRRLADQLRDVWYDARLARGLLEEAPEAYKDIHRVMRAQRDLVRVVRTLRPILCYKGV